MANFLNIAPREGDMIVPPVYLDKEAMFDHHFLERNEQVLHYRLIYDRRNVVPITLPAPTSLIIRKKEDMLSPGRKQLNTRGERRKLTNTLQLRRRLPLHLSTTPVSLMDISQAVLGTRPT